MPKHTAETATYRRPVIAQRCKALSLRSPQITQTTADTQGVGTAEPQRDAGRDGGRQ